MTWRGFPVLPPSVIVLLGLVWLTALAWGSWQLSRKHVPRRSIVQLGLLRLTTIVLLVLGLFRPVMSVTQTVRERPGLMVLVDASGSMSAPASDGSRWGEVTQKLANSPAIQSASKNRTLHWFTFDRRASPLDQPDWDRINPAGKETDIAASLRSAANSVQLWNASRAIVASPGRALIVSDGLHRGSEDVAAAAAELGLTLDVLAPSPAGDQPPSSAAEIVLVQAAPRVLIGSETAFQATIRADQSLESLQLVLEEDGQEVERCDVAGLSPDQDQFVTIAHRPKVAGLKRYAFSLQQGTTPLGQPYAVNVQVVDGRQDVLILEDTWRWQFKYLRRVLEDDPTFHLTALLSRGENAFVQFGEPERRVKLGGFPQSRAELDGFDTIVLGDVRPDSWPRGLARHLAAAVTDGGKSLVAIVGPHIGEWIDNPELHRLLPVELTREAGTPISGPIEVRLTPQGRQSSWFRLADRDRPADAHVPEVLPALEHVYPVLRKRPAATVLLEAAGHQNVYGPLPVIAEHTAGKGRVLFVGTDTLWKWQLRGPQTDGKLTLHAAFWQHAFRALAPTEPTSARRQLFLRPQRTRYRVGDAVEIAIATSIDDDLEGTLSVQGTVILPDGRRLPLEFSVPGAQQSTQAKFEVSQPGRYRIDAAFRSDGQTVSDASVAIEVAPRRTEMDGTPVDLAALERWAAATGGRAIDPDAADGWVGAENPPARTVTRRQSYDLWHNLTILLVLSMLLAADWTLRLFRGYV